MRNKYNHTHITILDMFGRTEPIKPENGNAERQNTPCIMGPKTCVFVATIAKSV